MSILNILISILLIRLTILIEKPLFVFELFRHGARGPFSLDSNNKDTFGEIWDNPEQLTNVGRRMHYILGYRNHKRYIEQLEFLSKRFDPHELYLISSDINRTIESGICHLQGLYPPYDKYAEKINDNQIKFLQPPINISQNIQNKINELNNQKYPLPHLISSIPFHIYNDLERRFNLDESPDCFNTIRPIKEKNLNIKEIKDIVKEFDINYKESFNLFLHQKGNYSFPNIVTMCDQFTSDIIDGRNLSILIQHNINIHNFSDFCGRVADIDFIYYLYGDEKKEINEMSMSPMLSEMLTYLKNRINGDINKENIDKNLNKFSNPKFIMISGHDTTISGLEIFINNTFNKSYNYIRPTFASSLFFEVYKINNSTSSFKDYEVHYIINDNLITKFNLYDFIYNIEKKLWNKKKIADFCKFNSINDSRIIWIIILGIICFILLIIAIILLIKYMNQNYSNMDNLIEFKLNG